MPWEGWCETVQGEEARDHFVARAVLQLAVWFAELNLHSCNLPPLARSKLDSKVKISATNQLSSGWVGPSGVFQATGLCNLSQARE